MDYVYAIGIIISVLGVIISIQYIKSKGYIKADQLEQAIDALSVAERLINMLNLKDEVKVNVNMVLDTADKVADYVYLISNSKSVDDKSTLANEVIGILIDKLEIKISESEKNLVKIAVDASLDYLEGKV